MRAPLIFLRYTSSLSRQHRAFQDFGAMLFSRQNIDAALLYLLALLAEFRISNIRIHFADFRVFHDRSSSER